MLFWFSSCPVYLCECIFKPGLVAGTANIAHYLNGTWNRLCQVLVQILDWFVSWAGLLGVDILFGSLTA